MSYLDETGLARVWEKVQALIDEAILDAKKAENPVGKIIINTSGENPATYLGFGTWVAWGKGRTIIGVGTNEANTSETFGSADAGIAGFPDADVMGGEYSHYLATGELPAHTHTVGAHSHGLNSHTHSIPALSGTAASAGAHTHTGYSHSTFTKTGSKTGAVFNATSDRAETTSPVARSAGAHTHDVTTVASTTGAASGSTANSSSFASGSVGSGTAHNNVQPYVTCYMWKRTA